MTELREITRNKQRVNKEPTALIISIDLGDGSSEYIKIGLYDDPNDLAQQFCQKYKLNSEVQEVFAKLIENTRTRSICEELESSKKSLSQKHKKPPIGSKNKAKKKSYPNNKRTNISDLDEGIRDVRPKIEYVNQQDLTQIEHKYINSTLLRNEHKLEDELAKIDMVYGAILDNKIQRTAKESEEKENSLRKNEIHKKESKSKSLSRDKTEEIQERIKIEEAKPLKLKTFESLYVDYFKRKEISKISHEKQKQEMDKKEQKECTFKPTLNTNTIEINKTRRNSDSQHASNIVDRLNTNSSKSSMKTITQVDGQNRYLKGCSFKPQLNEYSNKLALKQRITRILAESETVLEQENSQQKNNILKVDLPTDIFTSLHQDAKKAENRKLKLSKDVLANTCTFQPELCKSPRISRTVESEIDLVSRKIQRFQMLKEMRRAKELAEVEDPETGQAYFTPRITRGPKPGCGRVPHYCCSPVYNKTSDVTTTQLNNELNSNK